MEATLEELLDGPGSVLRMAHAIDDQPAKLRQHVQARALLRAVADRIGLELGTWEVKTTEDGESTWLLVGGKQAVLLRTMLCDGSSLGHEVAIPGMAALLLLYPEYGVTASLLTVPASALLAWGVPACRGPKAWRRDDEL